MFDKAWNPIKTLLLTGVCLTTLLAPYESEAAPENRNRSERLSKRARREAQHRQKQQRKKSPVRQKVTPTLEENLSPAQVTKKIQTIRRRVETAPENVFPAKDKHVFLEVFDDMIQTEMGRYIFEKAHPDLSFRVKQMERTTSGSYGYRSRRSTWENVFLKIFIKPKHRKKNFMRNFILPMLLRMKQPTPFNMPTT